MTTIYDVARRAQVSAATVSRVVNGIASVDVKLASRVQKAMRDLGYSPNAVARNLRRSRTSLWAVIISDVENPFFTALVRGVEDVAQQAGYSVVLCNSDEDPVKENQYISVAMAEQMAGVILSPSGKSKRLDQLISSGMAVVTVDRELRRAGLDAALVDNEHGARVGTAHLLDAGYKRLACIAGPLKASTATERLRGFRQALRAQDLPVIDELVCRGDFREQGGYKAMETLLDLPSPPDAVFVANNLMTVGAVECLVDRGVSIPESIGVVGFDDIPWAHLVRPSLTTVTQPTYELGRTAATLLERRISDPSRPPSRIVLRTELQIRGSSQPHQVSRRVLAAKQHRS